MAAADIRVTMAPVSRGRHVTFFMIIKDLD